MSKITKKEKTLREGIAKWKNFLNEGAFKKTVNESIDFNTVHFADSMEPEELALLNIPEEEYKTKSKEEVEAIDAAVKKAHTQAQYGVELRSSATRAENEPIMRVINSKLDATRAITGEKGYYVSSGPEEDEEYRMTYSNDMPSKDYELSEARMGEYGKIDAEDGNPPTKIGRGNEEYMAAYNAVLVARGEEPLDIQKPDQAFLDALRSGQLEERDAGMEAWMEKFKLYARLPQNQPMDEFMKDNAMYAYRQGMSPKRAAEELRKADAERDFPESGMELYDLDENIHDVKVGDRVIANGYPGTITDLSIPGMATVALKRGEVSVPLNNIEKISHVGDPDVMYGSDDEYDDLDERSADDDRDLEEPVKYGTGHELEWDPKEEKLYDRKRDYYLSQEEEDAVVAARQAEVDRRHKEFDMRRQNKEFGSAPYHFEEGNENFSAKTEGANPAMNLQSKAKGKAMGLLQTAKAMAQAPSTEPARGFAAAVSKAANEIVDLMVELEGYQVAGYMEESAWGGGATGGIEHAANLIKDARNEIDKLLDREYELTSQNADWEMIVKGLSEALYIISQPMKESNEPFDMKAHMAAYESEPETIEYRKQINKLIQMVAAKKGIPVEQAAEEIASYAVTYQNMEEAIGMQNIEKRRKPAAAPAAGGKINPTSIAKQFIKDKGYDKHFDLSDVFKVMALTDYLRKAGADTEEKVQTAVIDYIQHDGRSLKEGGDKEARIRDVVKMGSWDNIDGVPLSLPQAELLVAAMDNLNDTNKKKLMAMPIDKMLDIVNKMVDAGVITVNYGRAGLREMMGASRTTYSSDPELDQIEDIAKDMLEAGIQNGRIPVGLNSVASALKAQGFDATVSSGVLNIDGKYFMGKESKFDISPNEDVRRVMGFVLGYMG